jgi:hypothetical protein
MQQSQTSRSVRPQASTMFATSSCMRHFSIFLSLVPVAPITHRGEYPAMASTRTYLSWLSLWREYPAEEHKLAPAPERNPLALKAGSIIFGFYLLTNALISACEYHIGVTRSVNKSIYTYSLLTEVCIRECMLIYSGCVI